MIQSANMTCEESFAQLCEVYCAGHKNNRIIPIHETDHSSIVILACVLLTIVVIVGALFTGIAAWFGKKVIGWNVFKDPVKEIKPKSKSKSKPKSSLTRRKGYSRPQAHDDDPVSEASA